MPTATAEDFSNYLWNDGLAAACGRNPEAAITWELGRIKESMDFRGNSSGLSYS